MAESPADAAPAPRTQSTRRKARKRAIDILFEAELRGTDPQATLDERTADANPPVRDFTAELVRGVINAQSGIDTTIAQHLAAGWSLERIPRVDRITLRIGVHELIAAVVPPEVVIAEAVALVSELSTDESPAFVNGVLSKIAGSSTS